MAGTADGARKARIIGYAKRREKKRVVKERKSKLTQRDLEAIMPLFGFFDVKEFKKFVEQQEGKRIYREAMDNADVRVVDLGKTS